MEETQSASLSPQVKTKKPWQSKTNWVALVTAVLSFFPQVGDWVANNPEIFMQVVAGVTAILRWVTDGKISIK